MIFLLIIVFFNVRNGDWSDKSPLWTPDIRKELNPTLEENDGTFWMCKMEKKG